MDSILTRLQLALRERQRAVLLCVAWLMLTVFAAVAGPFGTHDVLSLPGRFGYWGVLVALSILLSLHPLIAKPLGFWRKAGVWTGYTVTLTLAVFTLNYIIFGDQPLAPDLPYLLVTVGVSVAVVNGILWLFGVGVSRDQSDPVAQFLRRLPHSLRGQLVRIEAQDHYLKVVTTKGSELILMRLSDAADELGRAGLLVHRSHWVSPDAVRDTRRDKGRAVLVMSDGAEVPVSRSKRADAQAAGLI